MPRRSTSTSAFGVSRRESHDSSAFYRRFSPPELSADGHVHPDKDIDRLFVGDSRKMAEVPDSSVALVVTSPPYFVGKRYEEALGQDGVPGSYLEYLDMLRDVFSECARTLEPGGRIAVNVANLGRRPYRSLSADVTSILQDDLRLLLRGEVVWAKQRGSSGSCAWGSFQSPANPVLRDLTERVVVACKGRFDRALSPRERARRGLPHEATVTREDFMEDTLDVWEIPSESARRVGHPAPFPVELVARFIELYTYSWDLVLDPFAGSGTTAVAALRAGRHYAGYELDEAYVRLAEERLAAERRRPAGERGDGGVPPAAAPAGAEGRSAKELARQLLARLELAQIREDRRMAAGLVADFAVDGPDGASWLFLVAGPHSSHRGGLQRGDSLWAAVAKASVLYHAAASRVVLLTTALPAKGTSGAEALRHVSGPGRPVHAVVDILAPDAAARLAAMTAQALAR